MIHVVLFEPEIPPNTGNIMRLAVNVGARLTLVKPLGFELTDTKLRRAGLDYRELARVTVVENIDEALQGIDNARVFAFSTKARQPYTSISYQQHDTLLFGPESRGLPDAIRERFSSTLVRIPMQPESRSLNLGNAVAIALYEAWRQLEFMSS